MELESLAALIVALGLAPAFILAVIAVGTASGFTPYLLNFLRLLMGG